MLRRIGWAIVAVMLATGGLWASGASAETSGGVGTRMVREPVFGGRVFLREAGQSNPQILVLVHGIGDEAGKVWDPLIPELARTYHVVAPDLPGFGLSDKDNQLYSPDAYAAFLDWLIGSLPPKPVNLVGHSLGGGISLAYAADRGRDLNRLVLIDAVGVLHYLAVSRNYVRDLALDQVFILPVGNPIGKVAGLLLEKATGLPLTPDIILANAFLRQRFLAGDPARIAGLALAVADYSLVLRRIAVPAWLIWGADDRIAPLRIATALDWILPRSQQVVLAGAGHVPMTDSPAALKAALVKALTSDPEVRQSRTPEFRGTKASCNGKRETVFSGVFDEISIADCDAVVLRDVTVAKLKISDSEVRIERSRLLGEGDAAVMSVARSRVTLTGVDIRGETGIATDRSRLDLAGVRFIDAARAIVAEGSPSAVLCSSSSRSRDGRVYGLHLSRPSLRAGESL